MCYKDAAHVLLVATKIEGNPGHLRSDLSYLLRCANSARVKSLGLFTTTAFMPDGVEGMLGIWEPRFWVFLSADKLCDFLKIS